MVEKKVGGIHWQREGDEMVVSKFSSFFLGRGGGGGCWNLWEDSLWEVRGC